MAKGLFRIKSRTGFFEDVTQPEGKSGTGKLANGQIREMERTARLQTFLQNGGLEEISRDSEEYAAYLAAEEEEAKAAPVRTKTTARVSQTDALKDGFKQAMNEFATEQQNERRGGEPDAETVTGATGATGGGEPTEEELAVAKAEADAAAKAKKK